MKKVKSTKGRWIRRIFCGGVIAVAFLGLVVLGINLYVTSRVKKQIVTADALEPDSVDCILVLGAGLWDNNTMPSSMLKDRLNQAIALYQDGVSARILMSGDHSRDSYNEVNVMKNYAIDAGVPADDIFMDHAGFSTYESIYRAKDIFQVESMVIVTQEYHLYRALYIADELGVEAKGVAADSRVYASQIYNESREALARVKAFGTVILNVQPTYMGEVIPISGKGSATDD